MVAYLNNTDGYFNTDANNRAAPKSTPNTFDPNPLVNAERLTRYQEREKAKVGTKRKYNAPKDYGYIGGNKK